MLTDTDITARITAIAASEQATLTDAQRAWMMEMARSWLTTFMFSEEAFLGHLHALLQGLTGVVDMDGTPITVGATLLAPFAKGGFMDGAWMRRMVVEAILLPEHRGYGVSTCALTLRALDTGKRQRHHYPKNCLVIAPPPPASSRDKEPQCSSPSRTSASA